MQKSLEIDGIGIWHTTALPSLKGLNACICITIPITSEFAVSAQIFRRRQRRRRRRRRAARKLVDFMRFFNTAGTQYDVWHFIQPPEFSISYSLDIVISFSVFRCQFVTFVNFIFFVERYVGVAIRPSFSLSS